MKKFIYIAIFMSVTALLTAYDTFHLYDFNSNATGAGLAGALISSTNAPSAVGYNPAGLAGVRSTALSIAYDNEPLSKSSGTFTSAIVPIEGFGTIGLTYIVNKQLSVDDAVDSTYHYDGLDNAGIISYAVYLMDILPVGINLKYVNSKRNDRFSGAISFDMGTILEVNDNLNLGMAIKNLGMGLKYGDKEVQIPAKISFGAQVPVINDNKSDLTIMAGCEYSDDFALALAFEFAYAGMFTIRIGDSYKKDGADYLSLGLGIVYDLNDIKFKLDFAYLPKVTGTGGFMSNQIVTIGAGF